MKLFNLISKSIPTAFGIIILLSLNPIFAQDTGDGSPTCPGNGVNFIDENGDGFNDNARDFDGDGIPNGMDDDFVRRSDRSKGGFRANTNNHRNRYSYRHSNPEWRGYGPHDGTGNRNTPQDGSGYGPGDGTRSNNGGNRQHSNGNR